MTKSIQLILFISLSFLIIQCSIKHEVSKIEAVVEETIVSNQDSFELSFNIFPDEITYKYETWRKLDLEIYAELKLTSLKKKDIEVYKTIFYGLTTEGDSHIEVVDFDNNTIDVEREMHYQYPIWEENLKVVNLESNEFKIDTIDLDVFYVFEKGIYKIRYVDTSLDIFSNWDTLKIN